MTDALDLGIGRDRFWALTIRELFQEFASAIRQKETALDRDARQVWIGLHMYGRLLSKKGKRPALRDYLITKPAEESPAERASQLRNALHMLSKQYGGAVRTVKANAK